MARTPDIGTTISEGYSNGFERIGPVVAFALVPALVMGALAGASAFVQGWLFETAAEDAFEAYFSGGNVGASFLDRLIYGLVDATSDFIISLLSFGVLAALISAFVAARATGSFELAGPGASLGISIARVKQLLPKAATLAGLSAAASLLSAIHALLGLVSFAIFIVLIYLSIRWIYAPAVVGAGVAEGEAAYEQSEAIVDGKWWPTFGIYLVVALAIFIPFGIVGGILAAILGAIFGILGGLVAGLVGAFVMIFVLAIAGFSLGAAALESAWHQVSAPDDAAGGMQPPVMETPAATAPPEA
jgi:hypothetical protein